MEVVLIILSVLCLAYNVYMADGVAKIYRDRFSVNISKDMIDSIAYGFHSNGLEPPYHHTRMKSIGVDKAVLGSDRAGRFKEMCDLIGIPSSLMPKETNKPGYGTPMLAKILPELIKYGSDKRLSRQDVTAHLTMKTLHSFDIPSLIELKSGGLDYTVYLHEDNWKKASPILYSSLVGSHVEHHVVPESIDRSVEAIREYRRGLDEKK